MSFRRESYIRYRSFVEACEELSAKDYKILNMAMDKLALDGEEPTNLTGHVKHLFALIRPQIIANTNKYLSGFKGKEDGVKGGNPKGNINNPHGHNQYTQRITPMGLTKDNPYEDERLTPNDNDNEEGRNEEGKNENVLKEISSNDDIKKEAEASYTQAEVIEDVGWDKFQKWLSENTPTIQTMKQPFTKEQYHRIKLLTDNQTIIDILQAMENYLPLKRNNKSAYLTFLKWHNKRKEMSNGKESIREKRLQEYNQYARELINGMVGQ